jgi:hypothetical protein
MYCSLVAVNCRGAQFLNALDGPYVREGGLINPCEGASLCGSSWTNPKKCQSRPNPAPTRTVTTKAKANPSTMPTLTLRSGKPSPMSSWRRSSCACLSSPSRASVPSAARGTTPSSTQGSSALELAILPRSPRSSSPPPPTPVLNHRLNRSSFTSNSTL